MAVTFSDYATLCDEHGRELVDEQIALEERAAGIGIDEFHSRTDQARQDRNETGTRYGLALLRHGIGPVAEGIGEFLSEASSGKPGVRHTASRLLEAIDPEVAALIALRTVIDGVTSRRMLQTVAIAIGTRIEAEQRYRALADRDGVRAQYVARKASKATTFSHARAVLTYTMAQAGVEWAPWPETDKLHLGVKLIDIIMDKVGLVECFDRVVKANRTHKCLTITAAAEDWIMRQIGRSEALTPPLLPTVIPPRDWTSPTDGGYHTAAIPELSLVKTGNRRHLEALAERKDQMPAVYRSINALQRTPWTINGRVLEVANLIWEGGEEIAGLPPREDIPSVQCPKCHANVPLGRRGAGRRGGWEHACFTDGTDEAKDALSAWKSRAAVAHMDNVSGRSRRFQTHKILWTAALFRHGQRIYMPYQMDFRGRVYAVPYLNPQGPDLMKGLLTLGRGLPIEDGVAAGWLAIQGANVWGFDKASLEDRVGWVEDHQDEILASADDPLSCRWWTRADKPWQFLAFAFEWAGFCREGYGFVSHLPVALDGSCSGIQHFSAMLRDEVGGAAVNLVPADKPADIYARVAEVAREGLCREIATGGKEAPVAQQLLDLDIDRKATKRQVMTLPYGATTYSCREYTEAWMRGERGDRMPWSGPDVFGPSCFLGSTIWTSIGQVVVAARAAMDWLQKCAKVVSQADEPIIWTTPSGFPVIQRYPSMASRRVKTKLGDSIIKLSLREDQPSIDRKRMASAISPNFVHSNDAAHLSLSVDLALDNDIVDFAMIHDSFGTHAANAELFGACLRHAFVDMYREHDVIEEFREAMLAHMPEGGFERLPPAPPKGGLDLDLVLQSDFFFA